MSGIIFFHKRDYGQTDYCTEALFKNGYGGRDLFLVCLRAQ